MACWCMLVGAHIQVIITALFVHLVECGILLMITRFGLLFVNVCFVYHISDGCFFYNSSMVFVILFCVRNKLYSLACGDLLEGD